jgi:Mn2+/Fe2+ NRAMP family transporter
MIVLGAGFVLLPGAPLLATIFYSQVLNGVLLPVVLVLMLLINNPRIMGKYVNGVTSNIIAWATVPIVGGLTIVSTIALFLGSGTAAG